MKKLLAASAFVALFVSPSLAQTVHRQPIDQSASHTSRTTPYGWPQVHQHSTNPAFDVYDSAGHYVGSDPDLRVRQELLRDENAGE